MDDVREFDADGLVSIQREDRLQRLARACDERKRFGISVVSPAWLTLLARQERRRLRRRLIKKKSGQGLQQAQADGCVIVG